MLFGITILLVSLLSLAVSVLCLSAIGNSLTTLRADIAEGFSHQVWQARVTRKAVVNECSKIAGYREPPTISEELERAMVAFARIDKNRVPTVDAGTMESGQ